MRSAALLRVTTGVLASAILGLVGAANAADTDSMDLRGTWKLEGNAVIIGAVPHHPASLPPPAEGTKPRLRPFSGTLRVDGQQDTRFWGILESPNSSEDFIGIFTGEDRRFIMVDSDGFFEGRVGDDGVIRYCYRHNTGLESRVVACVTATRE